MAETAHTRMRRVSPLLCRTLDLYRKPDDLGKQNGRQYDQVSKAAENGFHNHRAMG